jgi:hypothetical protein
MKSLVFAWAMMLAPAAMAGIQVDDLAIGGGPGNGGIYFHPTPGGVMGGLSLPVVSYQQNGGPVTTIDDGILDPVTLWFTTGEFLGQAAGTTRYGPGGTFSITDNRDDAVLFSGTFAGITTITNVGGDSYVSASSVIGTVPTARFGLTPGVNTGTFAAVFRAPNPGTWPSTDNGGAVGSADLQLTPAPEPSTIAGVAVGLVVVALVIHRNRRPAA